MSSLGSWLIWVDNDVWGYTTSLADAKWAINQIATTLTAAIQKETPKNTIDVVKNGDATLHVKSTAAGYIYNSQHTVHIVKYTAPIFQIRPDSPSSPRKRSPSFSMILDSDKTRNPFTRPPTPTPTHTPQIPTPPPLPRRLARPLTIKVIPTPPPLPPANSTPTPRSSPRPTFQFGNNRRSFRGPSQFKKSRPARPVITRPAAHKISIQQPGTHAQNCKNVTKL